MFLVTYIMLQSNRDSLTVKGYSELGWVGRQADIVEVYFVVRQVVVVYERSA